MIISNKLREYRKKAGLSQFDLAKLADVSPTEISRIETGVIRPFPAWRKRLAIALKADERELFPGVK